MSRRDAAVLSLATFGTLAAFAACSLVLDTRDQCAADSDCQQFGTGFTCNHGVCAGTAVPCFDEKGLGGSGCYNATAPGCASAAGPSVQQLYNACTASECIKYDNTRLALEAGLPPLPPPLPVPDAGADPGSTNFAACDLVGKSPVYVAGSLSGAVLMSKLARIYASKFTVVFVPTGSCAAMSSVATGSPITGVAWWWDPTFDPFLVASARRSCTLREAGVVPDVVVSDLALSTCTGAASSNLPAGWNDDLGPVRGVTIGVPVASASTSISQEAAYLVFGFGADPAQGNIVAPWNEPTEVFADRALAPAVTGLGTKPTSNTPWLPDSASVAARLASSTAPAKAIGLLDADAADAAAKTVRVLAYQAAGQSCGFLPDSATTSRDRINVRDGHYALWTHLHVVHRAPSIDDRVVSLASTLDGKPLPSELRSVEPGFDIYKVYADRGFVPLCAMHVQKKDGRDDGPLVPYVPSVPCGCYYEEKAKRQVPPNPGCKVCTADIDCGDGKSCGSWGPPGATRYCVPKVP